MARRLRAIPALGGTFLIALTGYGQPEDKVRTREAGFDLHLVKPVSLNEIKSAIDSFQNEDQPSGSGAWE